MPDEATEVRSGDELDLTRLGRFLKEALPDLEGDIEVLQFPGGSANLTYLLRVGDTELVLRRPPFGTIAPGAHDMRREHKVLSRLWRNFDRAPRASSSATTTTSSGPTSSSWSGGGARSCATSCPSVGPPPPARTAARLRRRGRLRRPGAPRPRRVRPGRPGTTGRLRRAAGQRLGRPLVAGEGGQPDPAHGRRGAPVGLVVADSTATALVHNDPKLDNCQFDAADPVGSPRSSTGT